MTHASGQVADVWSWAGGLAIWPSLGVEEERADRALLLSRIPVILGPIALRYLAVWKAGQLFTVHSVRCS